MDKCWICSPKILQHAQNVFCSLCFRHYLLKCISLDPKIIEDIEQNQSTRYCSHCLMDSFPFNNLEDDIDFMAAINESPSCGSLRYLSDKIFLPFELNDSDHQYGNDCLNPDLNYFSSYNQYISVCNYFVESSFNSEISKSLNKKHNFSLCHLNNRSIRKNLGSLEFTLENLQHEFSLIGITETWLKDDDCDLFAIQGYNVVKKHRQNRSGGGVALFIKDNIEYTIRSELSTFNDQLESVFIEINKDALTTDKNIIIGVIYRIPNINLIAFNTQIASVLEQLRLEKNLVYLMGDYNIDLLNAGSHDLTNEFVDLMYCNEFLPLISRPTRITATSATLIDNIFTNNHEDLNCSLNGILVADISDHFPIFHVNCSLTMEETVSYLVTRVYNERNKQNFLQSISMVDWTEICKIPDTQSSFKLFRSMLISLHDTCFPKIRIRKKYSNRKPWLSDAIRNSIRNKNKLYHKYKKIPSVRNEIIYKSFRNQLNHVLKFAEKKYYKDLIISHRYNARKSWSIIEKIINKHRKPSIQSKFQLNDGTVIDDKKLITESFKNFFINIGPTLAKSFPCLNKSPLASMGDMFMESIYLQPVTCEEIGKILLDLKNTACGWDEMSASFLRLSSQFITQPLAFICNQSLTEGVFPEQLNLAYVIPLYKAEDPMLFNHYRPASLLCVLSKVFEKVMSSRLLDFLEKFKILYSNQFGFRKGRFTHIALMISMDKITKSLENGEFVVGVFLDFSKAFDTVNHDILLQKQHHYGIRGSAMKWFQSYLSDRNQYVTYNGTESSKRAMKCGVPQGSIRGPLLFLIYINDLSKVCNYMMPLLFADDTNIFASGLDVNKVQQEVEIELNQISEWLKINKLSLNIKKTHFIVFTNNNVLKPVL